MLASRRHRMRAKLYQSSRAIATLTPSSNQKDFTASEWKRKTAARLAISASKLSSSGEELIRVQWGIEDSSAFCSPEPPEVRFAVLTMEIRGAAEKVATSSISLFPSRSRACLNEVEGFLLRLKQPFVASQIAQRSEIRHRECEAI